MTDKLKLFKVRLASGAERVIVAPDFAAVAQLRFEGPADSAFDDAMLSVDFAGDVDFVILREPQDGVTPPPAAIITADVCLHVRGNTRDLTHDLCECRKCGFMIPETEWAKLEKPTLTRCAHCGRRFDEPGIGCTQERCADPGCVCNPPTVGSPCPQCGGPLHASLGQLMCSLGHQVGPVPEGPADPLRNCLHVRGNTRDLTHGDWECRKCGFMIFEREWLAQEGYRNQPETAGAPRDIAGEANDKLAWLAKHAGPGQISEQARQKLEQLTRDHGPIQARHGLGCRCDACEKEAMRAL